MLTQMAKFLMNPKNVFQKITTEKSFAKSNFLIFLLGICYSFHVASVFHLGDEFSLKIILMVALICSLFLDTFMFMCLAISFKFLVFFSLEKPIFVNPLMR